MTLYCALCIQEHRNHTSTDEPPAINEASTIVNGMAFCDIEGRHRILAHREAALLQSGQLLVPNGAIHQ